MRRQISTASLCLLISSVLLKVLLYELETGNGEKAGIFHFFLNLESTIFVSFIAFVDLKDKSSDFHCKFNAN